MRLLLALLLILAIVLAILGCTDATPTASAQSSDEERIAALEERIAELERQVQAAGADGAAGAQGARGPEGPTGADGAIGPQGERGPAAQPNTGAYMRHLADTWALAHVGDTVQRNLWTALYTGRAQTFFYKKLL